MRNFLSCGLLLLSLAIAPISSSLAQTDITTEEGDEIPVEVYGQSQKVRLLWFPAETGLQQADRMQARQLAEMGLEVWLVDLFSARFLPLGQSSMERMPAEDVRRVIAAASSDGARVYLLAPGRGAVPLLRGARAWQQQQGQLAGIILLHPKLYVETPDPGVTAQLLPIVSLSNQSIYLLQPALSPWRWRLESISSALQEAGSDLFIQLLPQVRDRFFFRPDANPLEDDMSLRLPQLIVHAIQRLQYMDKPRQPVRGEMAALPVKGGKKPRDLTPYAGDPRPPSLRLKQYRGSWRELQAEQGKVVLINFWASWCPPCVHEMPSMQRLYETYAGQGLEILAVNMAESEQEIEAFLRNRVRVSFPLLLDRDGAALKRWDVFAFPTSFVVDKQGRIRYALFGAVDWQNAKIKRQIEGLLAEK